MNRKILLCSGIIISILSIVNVYAAEEYYPNRVGNLWILETRDGTQQHNIEIVEKVLFRGKNVNVLHRKTQNTTDEFYIANEPNGDVELYWSKVFNGFLGDVVSEYNPPQTFIPSELEVGRIWKIIGEAGNINTETVCTVVKQENVTVPAGTFQNCFKIQQDFFVKAFLTIKVQSFMWLAPDIGIVKEQDTNSVVFELVQYKIFKPWDINRDQIIDIYDLVLVGKHFGEQIVGEPEVNPDVNGDGVVNIFDLVLVGSHFGETTSSSQN